MTSRELLSIKEEFSKPFWKLAKSTILDKVADLRKTGSLTHITNQNDMSDRDEALYGANALEQFVEGFPQTIDELYKQQLEKEETNE